MDTLVLMNPEARRAQQELVGLKAAIADAPALDRPEIVLTESAADTTERAASAAAEGRELVVAAGGDGTVHAVVNGLLREGGSGADAPESGGDAGDGEAGARPTLAVVPLGTGNDLVRSLGLHTDPREALQQLESARRVAVDVIRVRPQVRSPFFCANMGGGGFGGRVEEEMTDDQKDSLGPVAYLRTALQVVSDLQIYRTRVRIDEEEEMCLPTFSVVISNGRFAGGGIPVAPKARLDDGLLDVLVIPAARLADAGVLAARIASGKHLEESEKIRIARARRVEVASRPCMPYSMDGELTGRERRVEFEVLPEALRVLAGDRKGRAV